MIVKEINPHFEDYVFNWEQTYQFLVGGYGSSKSYHTALKIVLKLLKEKRTALVIREVFDTHRDSTFALFQEVIEEARSHKGCGISFFPAAAAISQWQPDHVQRNGQSGKIKIGS